jgi:hypothetical protein
MGEHDVEWSAELTRGQLRADRLVPTGPETLDERLRAAGSSNANATRLERQNIASWPAPELQHLRARPRQCDDIACELSVGGQQCRARALQVFFNALLEGGKITRTVDSPSFG